MYMRRIFWSTVFEKVARYQPRRLSYWSRQDRTSDETCRCFWPQTWANPNNNGKPEDTGSSPGPSAPKLPCAGTRQALGCRHYLRSHPVRIRLHRVCRGCLQPKNCWCCYTLDNAHRCAAHGGIGTCVNDCRTNPWKPTNSPQRSGQPVRVTEVFHRAS